MKTLRVLLFSFLCSFSFTALFAQVDTGTIAGTVRDSQGASVASATVTLTEVDTNAVTKTQTDASG
ncbi:MAG TPA: carboxypeptidase-like regulatory domain-containing protein, partial [Terriglobales bacterium]